MKALYSPPSGFSDVDMPAREVTEVEKLIERLDSHMGKAEVPDLLRDCRLAAAALIAAKEENDMLAAELAEYDESNRQLVKGYDFWRDKAQAAEAENDRLRKALEPFAAACSELFNDRCPDDTPAWWIDGEQPGDENRSPVTVGDFRNA